MGWKWPPPRLHTTIDIPCYLTPLLSQAEITTDDQRQLIVEEKNPRSDEKKTLERTDETKTLERSDETNTLERSDETKTLEIRLEAWCGIEQKVENISQLFFLLT